MWGSRLLFTFITIKIIMEIKKNKEKIKGETKKC